MLTRKEILALAAAILEGGDFASKSPQRLGYITLAKQILDLDEREAIVLAAAHVWAGKLAAGYSPFWMGFDTPKRLVEGAKGLLEEAKSALAKDEPAPVNRG